MHSTQHASNEFVDAIAFLDQRDQRGYPALVVCAASEVGEDELLERIDLVLQRHEIGDGLVAFVGIIDGLQADVFLVLKSSCLLSVLSFKLALALGLAFALNPRTIELRVLSVERKLGHEIIDVL